MVGSPIVPGTGILGVKPLALSRQTIMTMEVMAIALM